MKNQNVVIAKDEIEVLSNKNRRRKIMKAIKKISVFLMAMMLYIGLCSIPVYGASLSQDGLEVNLTADKEIYEFW